ncbi:MAG TPA: hypothetical protein VFV83_01500 [Chthoniobacteraceae bacterium]|nr:hypothetical protein [Chthoniobacteraceae bacterium]
MIRAVAGFGVQVRPYETADNKISGVLLIFFDINDAKRANDRLKHASHYADAIIDTVPASLLVLDGELRVKRATPAFCSQFRIAREEVEGELLYHLGNHQWDIPALRLLLEEVLPKDSRVTNFKVEHFFPKIGKKTMVLNARRVAPTGSETPVIVLGFAEVPA